MAQPVNRSPVPGGGTMSDPIFEPLRFRNLTVKNRIFRSSISGRIDNYDGSGTPARVNWEEQFAAGGVGGIISAHSPVHVSGRILPNYAHIDADDKIPFWRRVGERVHAHDCAFILQLSHGGRQRDIAGVENAGTKALSATDRADPIHGIPCRQLTVPEIRQVVDYFGQAARRAREAGLDGVELHASNGYLINQFLSSAINTRTDDYGGSLENRARLLIEVVQAVRTQAGHDFHLQVKLSGNDHNGAFLPWLRKGNTIEDTVQVARWVEEAGADGIHVSVGSFFPHPLNPAGDFLPADVTQTYDTLLSSGTRTARNYMLFRLPGTRSLSRWMWRRSLPAELEGLNLADAAEIRRQISIPVLCTGGFQTASTVRAAILDGACDGVSIGRPLMANVDLVKIWAAGKDAPDRPCSYCNRCLFHVIEDPLGCYDTDRFDGDQQAMLSQLMSFYTPDGVGDAEVPTPGQVP
jgi:2,4-dienoyl-CoA reductase-like NADH-dependent reductase (Old Yellow Enzyme family)